MRIRVTLWAMEPATYISIGALVISLGSLVVLLVSSTKTYGKSKRDAFTQRRDRLSQAISDLSAKNTDARLLAVRFEIVALRSTGLALRGEQAEDNASMIASLKEIKSTIQRAANNWDENIEIFHGIYANLSSHKQGAHVERVIARVQLATDDLQSSNDGYRATLHLLETTNQLIATNLADMAR